MILKLPSTVWFLLLCLCTANAQEKDAFQPKIWLKNPVERSTFFANKLNYNNPIPSQKSNFQSLNQHLNSASHFFLVYKSEKGEHIAAFLGKERGIFIGSEELKLVDTVGISGYNELYGELLDMRFSSLKSGRLFLNTQLKDSYIYEAILTGNLSDKKAVHEIRTYLSLKYGINLTDHSQYFYKGKELWDGGNASFNHHIFGLAHLHYFRFKPQKSIHSKNKDLELSVTSDMGKYNDGQYVLVGNNNKPLNFDSKTNLSTKTWLLQTNIDGLLLNLSIPVDKIDSGEFSEYELVVRSDTKTAAYKGKVKKGNVLFENIRFNHTSSFINLKSIEPELKISYLAKCEHTLLSLKDFKNIKDFEMVARDDKNRVVLQSDQLKKGYIIPNKDSRFYTVEIKYNGTKRISKKILSQKAALIGEDLRENYVLDHGKALVSIGSSAAEKEMKYSWLYHGTVIGEGPAIVLSQTGSYELVAKNGEGCESKQTFTVSDEVHLEQWTLYPNPASEQDEIFTSFSLAENVKVDISVYQVDGKKVKDFRLGMIQSGIYSLGTLPSGTYVVIAYMDNTPQIKKLIIK